MKRIVCLVLATMFVVVASAQENPLAKCSVGDWGKYLITTKNETVPLMSAKDSPRWWVVSNVSDEYIRVDSYMMFAGKRSGGGGNMYNVKERFEPVPGIAKSTKVQVVSTSKETLTLKGKQYECTKIVRKIDQPYDDATVQVGWRGTSTIWLCKDVPLGLAKMENAYQNKLTASDKGQKINEIWVLSDFGFKDWKEE
jgi:hypothetical protein